MVSGISSLPKETRDKFMERWGWSISKQTLWENCPLAYYYRYVHSWHLSGEEKEWFKRLKNLKTVSLVHGENIAKILKDVLNKKESPDISCLERKFEEGMIKVFNRGNETITEIYNRLPISSQYFEKHIELGKKEIEYFINMVYPIIKDMKMIVVDEREKYKMDGRDFYSAPDFLAVDRNDVWHLMDWKTGGGTKDTEAYIPNIELQLGTYACYAIYAKAQGNKPWMMKLYAVFLQNPSNNIEWILTEEMHIDIKRKMIVMHDALLENTLKGPFPALPEKQKCRFCNYATVCDEGKDFLDTMDV